MTEHVYDTRALTDDQRSLADDIASAMGLGHEETCAVWWEDSDGCSCPLVQAVADGLAGANVVEVIQEMGYDSATQRGDRLERRPFRPHPLALPPSAPTAEGFDNETEACRHCVGGFLSYETEPDDNPDYDLAAAPPSAPPALDEKALDRDGWAEVVHDATPRSSDGGVPDVCLHYEEHLTVADAILARLEQDR